MNQLLSGVNHKSIMKLKNDDAVTSSDFAEIAIEESTEMIQAITKIKRGRTSLTDRGNLVEEMADNILATLYLMESLELTDEVRMKIAEKHERNCRNAEEHRFLKREKYLDLKTLKDVLKHEIKKAGGKKPKILCTLDDNFCVVVEFHLAYNLVYLQKYDGLLLENIEKVDDDYSEALFGTAYYSEPFFRLDEGFDDALKKVYDGYKNSIYI